MTIDYSSDWMSPRIVIFRKVYDLIHEEYDEEMDVVLYTGDSKDVLLVVSSDEDGNAGSINASNSRKIVPYAKEHGFKEIFIMGTKQTKTAYRELKELVNVKTITERSIIQLSEEDILRAFNAKAKKLCKEECDVDSLDKIDCKATKKGSPPCVLRNAIDNSKFHATMKWTDQLLNDFLILDEINFNEPENPLTEPEPTED